MRTCIAAMAMVLLGGCAGNAVVSPLQSAWYLQFPPSKSTAVVEIGLLNRSARSLEIREVLLNRAECASGDYWHRDVGFSMAPGQFVVLNASEFVLKSGTPCAGSTNVSPEKLPSHLGMGCFVPVSVAVRLTENTRLQLQHTHAGHFLNDARDVMQVELVGRMPSAIPDGWSVCR